MKTGTTSHIKDFDVHIQNDKALSKHPPFSPHPLARADRQVTRFVKWQSSGVGQTVAMNAMYKIVPNTPPQVDISAYRDVRRKIIAGGVGMWRWRIFSSLVIPRLDTISPSKRIVAPSSYDFAAYASKRNGACLGLFYRAVVRQNDPPVFFCFAVLLFCVDTFALYYLFPLLYCEIIVIHRYIHPVDRYRETGDQRILHHIVFEELDRLIFEGDQKKDGDRPEPGKPAKPKTEKPKPEREGDKGKRKGKSPRTEELVP